MISTINFNPFLVAHQAFGRRYSTTADEALPLYLRQSRFEALRARAERARRSLESL